MGVDGARCVSNEGGTGRADHRLGRVCFVSHWSIRWSSSFTFVVSSMSSTFITTPLASAMNAKSRPLKTGRRDASCPDSRMHTFPPTAFVPPYRHTIHGMRHTISISSVTANATKAQSGGKKSSRSSKSRAVPPLPLPAATETNTQQTISHSFTITGVGLHTGETTVVTVRPARSNEGRYFVRVPEGTNAGRYSPPKPQFVRSEQLDVDYGADDGLDPEERAQLFLQYLSEQGDEGDEEFGDYLQRNVPDLLQDTLIFASIDKGVEEPTSRGADEDVVEAEIGRAEVYGETTTLLRSASGNSYIMSPEALLSALEACGVDNARIEVEGGSEVPVADGSALTWALEVQKAGVRACDGGSNNGNFVNQGHVREMVTVSGGASRPGAFVSFYPSVLSEGDRAADMGREALDDATVITAGVDFFDHNPSSMGRQWVTWKTTDASAADDFASHYRWVLAPARPVFPSYEAVEEIYADGLLQAGPDGCCVIAEGDGWYDPNLVRFPLDEAARHAAQRLIGVLSLCATPGGRGLPSGHVVAFDATPEMMINFALKLKAVGEGDPSRT